MLWLKTCSWRENNRKDVCGELCGPVSLVSLRTSAVSPCTWPGGGPNYCQPRASSCLPHPARPSSTGSPNSHANNSPGKTGMSQASPGSAPGSGPGKGRGKEGSPVHGNRERRGERQEGPCTWDRGSGTIKLPGSCEYFDLSVGLALIDVHIFIQSFAGGASGEKPAC